MWKWKTKLDLSALWSKANERKITSQDLASFIAGKITKHRDYPSDDELQNIHDVFIGISENEDSDWNDIDIAMQELYDWADVDRRCWIKTWI